MKKETLEQQNPEAQQETLSIIPRNNQERNLPQCESISVSAKFSKHGKGKWEIEGAFLLGESPRTALPVIVNSFGPPNGN